jgi:hypothetical protein
MRLNNGHGNCPRTATARRPGPRAGVPSAPVVAGRVVLALDAALREELRGELRRSLASCDIPVFLVTHAQ